MIKYAPEIANEYNVLLDSSRPKTLIVSSVIARKYPGNIAAVMTRAYAELAQSKIAHARIVFLSFTKMGDPALLIEYFIVRMIEDRFFRESTVL